MSGHVALATYKPAGIENVWQLLGGLKILLPFAVLVAEHTDIPAGDISSDTSRAGESVTHHVR